MGNQTKLLLKDEVHRVVGCAMEVLNTLGARSAGETVRERIGG